MTRFLTLRWLGPAISWLLLIAVIVSGKGQAADAADSRHDLRSSASAWLDAFPPVASDTPRLARIQGIFRDIKRVSRGAALRARLYVIDSAGEPWAIALQDGNVILTRGALDVIYDGVDLATGDARMAFVLGHELEHIIANDFWHQQVYSGFVDAGNAATMSEQAQMRRKAQELRADEQGFLYASLAGFATRSLFDDSASGQTFLRQWARQTNGFTGDGYFGPDDRDRFLMTRLESLDEEVQFYQYGVRLAHFGRFDDARIMLEEFYKRYPSRQVLNNLGYVHLQLARRKMPAELAYRFWFPTVLEYDAGVPVMTRSAAGAQAATLPTAAAEDLRTAVDLLEAGTAMDIADIAGRINLIAAHLYLGQADAARAVLREAMEGRPRDPQLLGLKALIVMQNTDIRDPWDTEAREQLETLASLDGADDNLIYNYARLLEERGRRGSASVFWRKLGARSDRLPASYRYLICGYPGRRGDCRDEGGGQEPERDVSIPWSLAIRPGDDVDDKKTADLLKTWDAPLVRDLERLHAMIYRHPDGDSLLAIDHVVELVTIDQHGVEFPQALAQARGEPVSKLPLGAYSVWSYGDDWSALIRDDRVAEIWLAR